MSEPNMTTATTAGTTGATRIPPIDLPADPAAFYAAGADITALEEPTEADNVPVLERLGPLPLPRKKFPFLGFLASVYDHVAAHVKK